MNRGLGTFDVVIVGAGTAGCLLANRLSADPQVRVALLEAGGDDNYMWIRIPVGYLYCIGNPRTDWCYKTAPEPGLNDRSIGYPRGRVLGGSSSINAMLYLRGQARDYDEWSQLTGEPAWSWQNVLPIFMKSEDHWRGADEKHGEPDVGNRQRRGPPDRRRPDERGDDEDPRDPPADRINERRNHGEAPAYSRLGSVAPSRNELVRLVPQAVTRRGAIRGGPSGFDR